ncbi:MAG: hypothetical protein AAFW89_01935 [Bacteroidota bacterium]
MKHLSIQSISALLTLIVLGAISCQLVELDDDDEGICICLPPPPYQEFPRWSPNGQTILFYHYGLQLYDPVNGTSIHDPDSSGIWIMDSDGGNQRKILNASYADWSPDGKWIVYESAAQIFKARFNGKTIDTTSITRLTFEGRNFFPDWSSDGKWIAYDNTNCGSSNEPVPENSCGILIIDETGLSNEFLVRGRMPNWSPNHERLVYTGLENEVYRINLSTKSEIRLTFSNQSDSHLVDNRYPNYSPNGKVIAYSSNVHIWTMKENGKNLTQLTFDERGTMPDWSPDGEHIVYSGPTGSIWVMKKDGSNQRPLTIRPEGKIDSTNYQYEKNLY